MTLRQKKKQLSFPLRVSPKAVSKISKSAYTRAAILNAVLDLLWSHPFRVMTVNSLMAPKSLGRSVFYQYFKDFHKLMEGLLGTVKAEVLAATGPRFKGVGDSVVLLRESLGGLVDVCYHRGPILRAIDDGARPVTPRLAGPGRRRRHVVRASRALLRQQDGPAGIDLRFVRYALAPARARSWTFDVRCYMQQHGFLQ